MNAEQEIRHIYQGWFAGTAAKDIDAVWNTSPITQFRMSTMRPYSIRASGTTHVGMLQRTDWLIPMITDFLDSDLNAAPPTF